MGDVLVAAVADDQAEEAGPLLVGISGDGKVLWRGKGYTACWAPDDASLFCSRGSALVRVDPTTGASPGGIELAVAAGSAPVLDDGVLYVVVTPAGAAEDAYPPPFAVAALDAETLESVWPDGPAGTSELSGYGAGSPALDLTGPNVSVSAWQETRSGEADGSQFELDRATGAVLGSTHLGKGAFPERPWTVDRGFGNDKVDVYRDGRLLLELKGQPWDTQDGRLTSPEGRIGMGATLYDVTTGEAVWERSDLGDELSGWRWTADRAQVAVTGFDTEAGRMTTTYLDADTGETLWSGPGTDSAPTETPDAFVQVETDYESSWEVQALDRSTGKVAWSQDVTRIGQENDEDGTAIGGPYVGPGAVWALGATTLVGFTDFPG
ncbi:PQQ-binding-like beta-propeller repeat protein [Nocardioides humi]|uniref:outer membrane protein assembly factor BamB family protein n=1 Tax=Nocardioides humi TaxID=449461 RepID=UPI00112B0294|nr:PQQ-binding-like beta-propeller repeat protein [Nocardioides humi]